MHCIGVEARLIQSCSHIRQGLHHFQPFHSTCTQAVDRVTDHSEVHLTGHCGRPFLPVNIDQVEMLRGRGYTWDEVANAIGVSRATLWCRLTEQNVTLSPYVDICDHDFDQVVSRTQHDFPNAGLVMIQGRILSEGFMFRGREFVSLLLIVILLKMCSVAPRAFSKVT